MQTGRALEASDQRVEGLRIAEELGAADDEQRRRSARRSRRRARRATARRGRAPRAAGRAALRQSRRDSSTRRATSTAATAAASPIPAICHGCSCAYRSTSRTTRRPRRRPSALRMSPKAARASARDAASCAEAAPRTPAELLPARSSIDSAQRRALRDCSPYTAARRSMLALRSWPPARGAECSPSHAPVVDSVLEPAHHHARPRSLPVGASVQDGGLAGSERLDSSEWALTADGSDTPDRGQSRSYNATISPFASLQSRLRLLALFCWDGAELVAGDAPKVASFLTRRLTVRRPPGPTICRCLRSRASPSQYRGEGLDPVPESTSSSAIP